MTVVSDNLVQLHIRIGLLEALANHQRLCGTCSGSSIQNCELGWKLWLAAGLPKDPA